jgi:hypothetical protein
VIFLGVCVVALKAIPIPTAFAEMLRGENFGKTLVRVAPDPILASQRG